MPHALLTGATGYIGSHVALELQKNGWDIGIIARESSRLDRLEAMGVTADCHIYDGTLDSLIGAMTPKPDAVFHLAVYPVAQHKTEADIRNLISVDVLFGTFLLEAMRCCGVQRLIYASTVWQQIGGGYAPNSLYTATKQAYEDIVEYYCRCQGIRALSLRLTDNFGKDDTRRKVFNLIRNSAQSGELLKMSPGGQELDVLYIDDIAGGFVQAADITEHEDCCNRKYTLTSGQVITLREFAEEYERISGQHPNIAWGSLPYREHEIMKVDLPDNVLPGWKPTVSLLQGIKRFAEES
ncbi:MAG: NAD(P)-dependent oxidoreductase [Oscillibacter sp.]|jgi:nucleoside-diphosphate-sugar epimerase|nr:NAD(P)-dependent oxidoreductase [Oscillibacter sp.]